MKLKSILPNYKMPKLSLPKGSESQDKITKIFRGNKINTDGILKDAKSRIPKPLSNFIPNLNQNGSANKLDIEKIMKQSSFDFDGMLSKSMDTNSMIKSMQYNPTFDIDLGPAQQYVPSDILSSAFDI